MENMRKAISENSLEQLADIRSLLTSRKTKSAPILPSSRIRTINNDTFIVSDELTYGPYSRIYRVKKIYDNTDNNEYVAKILNYIPIGSVKRDYDGELYVLYKSREAHNENIIKYIDEIDSRQDYGFILEYAPYGDLHRYLYKNKDHHQFSQLYLDWCRGAVEAVNFLHSQSPCILHRDIKSPNYLITRNYRLCLTDFNLTRSDTLENRMTTLTKWRTTAAWTAPEAFGGLYTKHADIYSLGVVLWEILYTFYNKDYRLPFGNLEPVNIVVLLIRHPETRPVIKGIHKEWQKLLNRMWSEHPKLRPSSGKVLRRIKYFTYLDS
jgi:serine/threonine protein kinase